MLDIIIIIFGSVLLGLVTLWYYQYFKHSRWSYKFKGPFPIPIFGNIYRIRSNSDVIPVLMDYHKKCGPVMNMWFGFHPHLIISDYKTAELLLSSNTIIDKSYDYYFFQPWLGTGLLTSTGDKWRRQRKLLTPTFHFQILEQYIAIFNTQCEVFIETVEKYAGTEPFDIYPHINLCALDIICEAAMGIQMDAQKGSATDYVKAVTDITEIFLARTFSILKAYDFYFKLTTDYKRQQHALNILHGQTNYVIECRQKELATLTKDTESAEDGFGGKKRLAFLDLLLQCRIEGKPLPPENVREEVDTFMFEGHDTTTSGLCFTLYCLSQNIEVQNKVVKELHGIFNYDKSTAPSYKELQEMKYLELVIKESMRLYPPVPFTARTITKNTEFGETIINEDITAAVFVYALHRQEEMFPDPESFIPERFLPENSLKRSPFSYVPFSAGPRNCIGQRFAMLEMKSLVSKMVYNFEILPAPNFKPVLATDAILRSLNGVMLSLKKREF